MKQGRKLHPVEVSNPYREMVGLASGKKEFLDLWASICKDHAEKHDTLARRLIAAGVKMMHPDDGWVNRECHFIDPCYPDFHLRVTEGDWLCLGDFDKFRLVKCILAIERPYLMSMFKGRMRYYFDPVTQVPGEEWLAHKSMTLAPEEAE